VDQENGRESDSHRGGLLLEGDLWGMLYHAVQVEEDHHQATGIHLFQFVGYLLLFLFIKHPGTMLQSFRYSGPLHIETTLNSLLDAQWLEPQGASFSARPGSELDDAVTFAIATTSELLRDAPDDVVADLLRYLFFAVNWSALVDSPENVQRLVRPDASSISGNAWEEAKSSQFTPVTSERDLLSPIAREPAKVVDNYEIDGTLLGLRKDASAST
jgi:hypothetical protein